MQLGSWFDTVWTRIRESVILDVPPSLEQCECCKRRDCSQEHWEGCTQRLASETERLCEEGGLVLTATGVSEEMPGVSSSEDVESTPSEQEPATAADFFK
jgi:hypothetical protein